MPTNYKTFLIRSWRPLDRHTVADLIGEVLTEYGLPWQPQTADQDVVEVEKFYLEAGGEFWVIEQAGEIVGTAGYYPIQRGKKAVEIRKMYLLPKARGQGLGRFLLQQLEGAIARRGYQAIWIETASVLAEAVRLYETSGYEPATGIETERCDRVYLKTIQSIIGAE